jgi:hypothetical protein
MGVDIAKLLVQLDDVAAFGAHELSRSHLDSLCKQSAAAIRELQAANTRDMVDTHARFLSQLGDGLKGLAQRMQGHA